MQPISLCAAVMRCVAAVVAACFVGTTLFLGWQVRAEQQRTAQQTAARIAALFERQAEIEHALQPSAATPSRPTTTLESGVQPGQCAELRAASGAPLQRYCQGATADAQPAPAWFAALWPAPADVSQPLRLGAGGSVRLESDPPQAAGEAWSRMLPLIGLCGAALAVLGVLLPLAIARALRPMRGLLGALRRLADDDALQPIPRGGIREFDQLAEGLERLGTALARRTEERNALSRRLMDVQEAERRHLARELHDELGQSLAAIQALAAAIAADAPAAAQHDARRIGQIVGPLMDGLRRLVLRLRPPGLGEFGLLGSLRHLVTDWNGRGRTRFSLTAEGRFDDLPDAVSVGVFRVAQECLTNAARHAAAQDVRVRMRRLPDDGALELVVEDDGGVDAPDKAPSGLGRIGMQERVAALGGRLAMEPASPRGCRVQAWIPLVAG